MAADLVVETFKHIALHTCGQAQKRAMALFLLGDTLAGCAWCVVL